MCVDILLDDWKLITFNPYEPPENGVDSPWTYVSGRIYNDKRWIDGTRICTSRIIKVEGQLITTVNGTVYKLENVNLNYKEFCEKNNFYVPTYEKPIKTWTSI